MDKKTLKIIGGLILLILIINMGKKEVTYMFGSESSCDSSRQSDISSNYACVADSCISGTVSIEQCIFQFSTSVQCRAGFWCYISSEFNDCNSLTGKDAYNWWCIYKGTCQDSDGINYQNKGYVMDEFGNQYPDFCEAGGSVQSFVKEWTCLDGQPLISTRECGDEGASYKCYEGRCVSPPTKIFLEGKNDYLDEVDNFNEFILIGNEWITI